MGDDRVDKVIDHVRNGGNLENPLSGYRTIQLDSAEVLVGEIEQLRIKLSETESDKLTYLNSFRDMREQLTRADELYRRTAIERDRHEDRLKELEATIITLNNNWGRAATAASKYKDKLRLACTRLLEYIGYHERRNSTYNGNRLDDRVWAEQTLEKIDEIGMKQ